MLIAIGFIALVILAIVPRNVEVTVTTNIHEETTFHDSGSLHQPPELQNGEGGE